MKISHLWETKKNGEWIAWIPNHKSRIELFDLSSIQLCDAITSAPFVIHSTNLHKIVTIQSIIYKSTSSTWLISSNAK